MSTIQKINPSTGELLAQHPIATNEAVQQAVLKSQKAQQGWTQSTLKERSQLLKAIANALYQQANSLAEVISAEVGKPLSDAKDSDLGTAIGIFRYYAEVGPKTLAPQSIAPDLMSILAGRTHQETFYPRGVIGIIAPWNYPLAIPASGIAAAIMAGNSVVLKPSELAPETGKRLVELIQRVCQEQGFPIHLVQVVLGDGSTGTALLESPIDGIIFTGSERVGQHIAQQAAARSLWFSLELGGSDAMIILDSCDLDLAASYAVWGRFTNAGQACAAVKRLFVPQKHASELTQKLLDKVSQLKVGAPDETGNHFGPVISEQQLALLESQVQDAQAKGAKVLAGGQRLNRSGYFYAPTILAQVPANTRVLQEEVFGPVLPIIAYQTVDEAVQQANQSTFGLTASVFGPADQANAIAQHLTCGTVMINDIGASNYAMSCAPWGGWKKSGHGVSHGVRTLQELSLRKIVSRNQRFHWPILNKPLWLFGKNTPTEDRSNAILAFANRHVRMLHPKTWLAFWTHRSSTRL